MTLAFPHPSSTDALALLRPLSCRVLGEDEPEADREAAMGQAASLAGPVPRDQALVREVELLYRRHHPLVFRLALRYGNGSAAWAEDVTQDVFIDLFKAIASLDDRSELEGWLYKATIHRCLNRLRRERFLGLAPVRWLLGQQKAEPRQPDALVMARQDLQRAFAVLETLPVKERMAFTMYYLDEREQDDIGATLGHSKSYVCKLIQRAVARLQAAGWEVQDGRPT